MFLWVHMQSRGRFKTRGQERRAGSGEEGVVAHSLFSVHRRHSRTQLSTRALTADLPKQVSLRG